MSLRKQEKNKMGSGVYKIKIIGSDKVYIGSSIDLYTRKKDHLNKLLSNKHPNRHLQSSFNKHGDKSFCFSIVKKTKEKNLFEIEQEYIDSYDFDMLFNIMRRAGDTREMIKKKTGKKLSKEHRKKLSIARYGKKCKEETKRKIGIANRGRVLSVEHREKLSRSHRGKRLSVEQKEKIGNASLGKKTTKNTSGFVGVCKVKHTGKYIVRIKNINYGCYVSKEEAARVAARVYKKLGRDI